MTAARPAPVPEMPDLPGALCAQIGDPELWMPTAGDNGHAARAVCRRCPEMEACLAYAITNAVDGIWGGTGLAERQRLRRRYGVKAAPLSLAGLLETRQDGQRVDLDHGTAKGYALHVARGDMPACEPCRDADRAYRAELRARRDAA